MPRRKIHKKGPKLDFRAGMKRWQFELSQRGQKKEGVWWWPYNEVKSFCKRKDWASAYLRSGFARNVVYYQVLLYILTGEYIHHTRRNGKDAYKNIDYSSMTGYKKMLRDKCRNFVRI